MRSTTLSLGFVAAMCLMASPAFAQTSVEPPLNSKDFRAGFQKGSNDVHAHLESIASELDADFRFERFAVDGNLPPVLRNLDGGGPILRCNQMKSVAIVQNAQPLCKDKACKTKMTWRDFATVDLAPKSSGPHTPVIRPDEFKMGEEAAKNTALDNMRILSETYSGMATFRLLERCGLIEPQNTNTNTNTKPVP